MTRTTLLLIAIALLALPACRTKEKPRFFGMGGKGGNANITLYPQHHGVSKNLIGMMVYVKYGANDAPADRVYDDSMVCQTSAGVVTCTFRGLLDGYYYFVGKGYDTSVLQAVDGGTPAIIEGQGSLDVTLPVSED